MKLFSGIRTKIESITQHLVLLYGVIMDLHEMIAALLTLAQEARENVRDELQLAAAEQRAARATEERIRRALADAKGQSQGVSGGPGEDEPVPDVPGASGSVPRLDEPRQLTIEDEMSAFRAQHRSFILEGRPS